MAHLVIDIGNTRCKYAIFNASKMMEIHYFEDIQALDILAIVQQHHIGKAIVASVKQDIQSLETVLANACTYVRFDTQMGENIHNLYETPHTLGLDRWAAVCACANQYPQQNCLIIDAGSCITYDILTQNSTYLGGSISVGLQMRFNAMHHFTGKLPLMVAQEQAQVALTGSNTQQAISSGGVQGLLFEIQGFISAYQAKYTPLKIIFTGGDAQFLINQFKNSIFAPHIIFQPYLVLEGLNSVLQHQYAEN